MNLPNYGYIFPFPTTQDTKSHNFIMHILKNTCIFNFLKYIEMDCPSLFFLWKLQEIGAQNLEGVLNLIDWAKPKVQN